ncbi:calpain-1 catalytic subunit isoform X1 [Fundulus heteroclitus]|uniref:calpain-1 catalytic subunit isoform X1 n=1 Tax=Fundulus heteroclitus TaxID=8078 RepID=UPI00079E2B70|nr:calpain-1 catalytic subunit isoform X1 [Fundulus heteroclitus]
MVLIRSYMKEQINERRLLFRVYRDALEHNWTSVSNSCSQSLKTAAMPLRGVSQSIMRARQKKGGCGTIKNPETFAQQNYQQLKEYFLIKNMRFIDDTFPPDNTSIGVGKLDPADLAQVEWLRPAKIVTNPFFVLDGVSRFDFGQGKVGNCWFLASLGSLTFHKEIFEMVVPLEQPISGKDYCGLFHFRFWRFGKWVDVVIDDKLPTIKGKTIFARSKDECEFWPALLEKAYAKVCGSYADMSSGTPAEAMRDFTGGVHMCIPLSEPSADLWKLLCRAALAKTFMSCSTIPKEDDTTGPTFSNGLVPGHAYTVTGLKELMSQGKAVRLVRLWNPWGYGEWTGDWSDLSPLWQTVSTHDREKCLSVENDGEFWMNIEDCCKYYTSISVCGLSPDFLDENPGCHWKTSMYENRWVAGTTAGGCINNRETFWTNPQYRIKVYGKPNSSQSKNTLVSLMQKPDKRNRRMVKNLFIGFTIYEVSEKDETTSGKFPASFFSRKTPVAQTKTFTNAREVMEFLNLKPGEYLIVPSTLHPNETASFLLTIFSREETQCYENSGRSFNDPVEKVKKEKSGQNIECKKQISRQYSDKYEEVDADQLQSLLNENILKGDLRSGGFSIDACRSMVALMDTSVTGKLNNQEFVHLWNKIMKYKEVFSKMDVSQTGSLSLVELRNAIKASGMSVSDDLLNLMAVRYGATSGHMSLENFISLILRLNCMNKVFETLSDGKTLRFSKLEWMSLSMYN